MKIAYSDLLDMLEEEHCLPEIDELTANRIKKQVMARIKNAKPEKKTRRAPRMALIAVAAMLALSITVGAACIISHENTKRLIEAGPYNDPVEVDQRSYQVIDTTSRDYGLVCQDNGTTVTLDSIMGAYSDYLSIAYLTLTVQPAEGTEITAEVSELGFGGYPMPKYEKDGLSRGADGSTTVIRNEDGTYNVMLMAIYDGNVNGEEMTLNLEGFGDVSKDNADYLAAGGAMELPGQWQFQFEMQLDATNCLALEESLFGDTQIAVSEVTMSSFGGTAIVAGYQTLMEEKYLALAKEKYGALELNWEQVSILDPSYLENLYTEGKLTLEEFQGFLSLGNDPKAEDGSIHFQIALEYADGTVYKANTTLGAEPLAHATGAREEMAEQTGEATLEAAAGEYEDVMLMPFIFDAPQSISEAKYLIIEGVKIPLN